MINNTNQFSDIKNSNLDLSVDPKHDFYSYVNNNWMKDNPIPADRSRYGNFDKLSERNEIQLRKILEEAANEKYKTKSKLKSQIGNFYFSGMNTSRIEKLGIEALNEKINRINKLTNKSELANILGYLHKFSISPVFYFYGSPDPGNSEINIAHLSQGGLGLSDRDYYLNDDPYSKELKTEYSKHIKQMFILAGFSDKIAIQYSSNIIRIEIGRASCRERV